jgi:hypothetical protein
MIGIGFIESEPDINKLLQLNKSWWVLFAGDDILGLSPGVRQTVKALLTVRWNCIVPRKSFIARWAPAGEAAAGSAGAQPAKE